MKKNWRIHYLYWIFPTLVTLLCIIFYFFDSLEASHIISPIHNREFGILENLQLALILVMLFIAIRAAGSKKDKIEKYFFGFIAVLSVFLLFEEIDYGLHYYELVTNSQTKPRIRNIHNNGKITSHFKMAAYIFIGIFFVLLPMFAKTLKNKSSLLDYVSPSKYIIATAVCLFLLNQFAFYLYHMDVHSNRSLDGNISEFEELMIYYLIVLYLMELADPRKTFPFSTVRKITPVVNEE